MNPPKRRGEADSGRAYLSKALQTAAHPTRQAILRALESGPRTTVDLQEEVGESRYHLYHHLSVLEEAGLVESRTMGRAKEFSLRKPKRPDAVYLELEANVRGEEEKLMRLLKVLEEIEEGRIPHLNKVVRIRLMLSYPWTPHDDS